MDPKIYYKVATFEEQDRIDESQRPTADYAVEVAEYGEFSESGGTLSHEDYRDARAAMTNPYPDEDREIQ